MYGQNLLFNQPLAIDKGYLLSLIPNLFLAFQNKEFLSAEKIVDLANKKIEAQANFASENGMNTFPAVVEISGPIIKHSQGYYLGTQDIIGIAKKLDAHERVSGIVFNIDSGGGMVSGTSELSDTIKNLSKPTIAFTNGLMCSAAFDIASGADYRMASPYADMIGSIGTMLSYQDYSKMFEKWGATIYEVYAPQSTEKNKEWRELEAGNEKVYEEILHELNELFTSRMKENLAKTIQDDQLVFKGKTYNPQKALEVGLINEIGTLEQALSKF